ncbi:hypothetical protein [Falsiphaeobacter marinintestinus]|uniref:hypothetical protein n=1 Tax=Falsiphaeobacter marinintestinus TaxID=1492905 RepID=UPI0011B60412|nr:hypothetical protein [Phaeobacter marinintestinus]
MTSTIRNVALAACAAIVAGPEMALAWRAWNRHEVLPVSEGVYEVVAEVGYGTGARDYWCGIGDFAIRVLGTSAIQRIYIWAPEGPSVNRPGKKAVQFALQPPEGADTSTQLSLTVRRAGDNMNAASAQNYCYDNIERERFRLRP